MKSFTGRKSIHPGEERNPNQKEKFKTEDE